MCKISLWSVEYTLNQSTIYFGRFSNSIEISLVGWAPTAYNRMPLGVSLCFCLLIRSPSPWLQQSIDCFFVWNLYLIYHFLPWWKNILCAMHAAWDAPYLSLCDCSRVFYISHTYSATINRNWWCNLYNKRAVLYSILRDTWYNESNIIIKSAIFGSD